MNLNVKMFVKSTPSKVKFVDQQLDDYVLENSVLASKLQSKTEALSILSRALDTCAMERDRYRLLVEQLRDRRAWQEAAPGAGRRGEGGGALLAATRDHNNQLRLEMAALKARYEEATRDVSALTRQLRSGSGGAGAGAGGEGQHMQREQLLAQLEELNIKYQQTRQDLRMALDEKEELAADRDHYKRSAQQRSAGAPPGQQPVPSDNETRTSDVSDLETALLENQQLKEELCQLHAHLRALTHTLAQYKSLLNSKSTSGTLTLDLDTLDAATQQQVCKLVAGDGEGGVHLTDLRALCLLLLQALADKCLALRHHRRTNKLFANRIADLEKTLESWSNGEYYIPTFPSQMLMQEFLPGGDDSSDAHALNIPLNINSKCDDSDNKSDSSESLSDDSAPKVSSVSKVEYSMPRSGNHDHISTSSDSKSDTFRRIRHDFRNNDSEKNSQIKIGNPADSWSGDIKWKQDSTDTGENVRRSKITLPPELQDMVREALEQIRPC